LKKGAYKHTIGAFIQSYVFRQGFKIVALIHHRANRNFILPMQERKRIRI